MTKLKTEIAVSSFVVALMAATFSNAEQYSCTLKKGCSTGNSCSAVESKIAIFDRVPGSTRIDLGHSIIDMEEFFHDASKRRDWLINGVQTGYLGIVSLYEDGSLILSEHSQTSEGKLLSSTIFGKCETSD